MNKTQMLTLLEKKVCQCDKCPDLLGSRIQHVFGEGNPNTRIVFLGESPGSDEAKEGRPFIGRSGRLLDGIIEWCGWKRNDVYILNTIKCHPEWNRNPYPDEVNNCRPYLDLQLKIINPEIIVCLGAVAAQNLLQTTQSVHFLRHQWHNYKNAKVRVTFHPAFVLRKRKMLTNMQEDMLAVIKKLNENQIRIGG